MTANQRIAMYFLWAKSLSTTILPFYKTIGPIHSLFFFLIFLITVIDPNRGVLNNPDITSKVCFLINYDP